MRSTQKKIEINGSVKPLLFYWRERLMMKVLLMIAAGILAAGAIGLAFIFAVMDDYE